MTFFNAVYINLKGWFFKLLEFFISIIFDERFIAVIRCQELIVVLYLFLFAFPKPVQDLYKTPRSYER